MKKKNKKTQKRIVGSVIAILLIGIISFLIFKAPVGTGLLEDITIYDQVIPPNHLYYATYLKFDLRDIPADSVIESANINIYVDSINNYHTGVWDGDLNIYRINNQEWTESSSLNKISSTWKNQKTDLDNSQSITAEGWNSLDITTQIKNALSLGSDSLTIALEDPDAQIIEVESIKNDNFLLVGNSGLSIKYFLTIHSKEYIEDTSLRPYLEITYK